MSFLDKVNVGFKSKKYTHNLSATTSTTTNIARVAPTYSKFLPKDSSVHIKADSLVRLLAMTAPTFGNMSLRHYFKFVPCKELWLPFDEMISKSPYYRDGNHFIPQTAPTFRMCDLLNYVLSQDNIGTLYHSANPDNGDLSVYEPVRIDVTNNKFQFGEYLDDFDFQVSSNKYPFVPTTPTPATTVNNLSFCPNVYNSKDKVDGVFRLIQPMGQTTISIRPYLDEDGSEADLSYRNPTGGSIVPIESADYLFTYESASSYCLLAIRLGEKSKHLREILIGLGYQFNLTSTEQRNMFKLLAFDKCCFDQFFPQRDINYSQTYCWQLVDFTSQFDSFVTNRDDILFDSGSPRFISMIEEMLYYSKYFLPADYFSASQTDSVMRQEETDGIKLMSQRSARSVQDINDFATAQGNEEDFNNPVGYVMKNNAIEHDGLVSAIAQKMAMRLLPFVNKNSVVGRSVADYLKAHFGVVGTLNEHEKGSVTIGASRVNVQINPIFNTAESQDAYLGEFAATGIGRGSSDIFDYDAKDYGILLCLSVIVPDTSYFQGTLKENTWYSQFEFPTPEFDALGWQIVSRSELKDDYNFSIDGRDRGIKNLLENNNKGFGLMPRYSEIKVGRDIINGDLSLPSLFGQMGAYTLARFFPSYVKDRYFMRAPTGLSLVSPYFRQIGNGGDLDGDYSRIFAYDRNDLDHFMVNIIFSVRVSMPYQPLKNSFDTFSTEDDSTVDVNKL